jgi:N-hydroxyarylamine O-acetyltransferase
MVNLDSYFRRLNYAGPKTPSLETLNALSAAHAQYIPFENLNLLLNRGIRLELAEVERKLVNEQRGGYCFEQNTLFLEVLRALGFAATAISARVRLQHPRTHTPPRTHVFVRVELPSGPHLADVGVGALSLTSALSLEERGEQRTPHEPRRITFEDGRYFHQVRFGQEWTDVCEFTWEEMPSIDRELANWFVSTHPQSHFKSRLVVARALPNGARVSLLNRELTLRPRGEPAQTRLLTSPSQLLDVLAEHFALHFPAGTEFDCPALDWP